MKHKTFIEEYGWTFIGSFLFCAGLNWFIVPVNLYNGGTVGISQIIRTLLQSNFGLTFAFDIAGVINFIINIPLLILAFTKFGKSLFSKTLFSVVVQTILFSILPIPPQHRSPGESSDCNALYRAGEFAASGPATRELDIQDSLILEVNIMLFVPCT